MRKLFLLILMIVCSCSVVYADYLPEIDGLDYFEKASTSAGNWTAVGSDDSTLDGNATVEGDLLVNGSIQAGSTSLPGNITLSRDGNLAVVGSDFTLALMKTNPTELGVMREYRLSADDVDYYGLDNTLTTGTLIITEIAVNRSVTQSGDLSASAFIFTKSKTGNTIGTNIETNTLAVNDFEKLDDGTIDNPEIAAGQYIGVNTGKAYTGDFTWVVRGYVKRRYADK